MISEAFNFAVYEPLYNGLIFLVDTVPRADVGIAVILLTIAVKIILLPLAYKASLMQQKIRQVTPEINEIKKKYTDKQEQTLKTLELYKKYNIRPFSSVLVMFVQIPVIFGLYWVFFKGGLPAVNTEILYSFVSVPVSAPNMMFIGFFDMAGRSILFALIAGVTQFLLSRITLPKPAPKSKNPSLKEDLAHSMHLQMKYVMPIIIAVISYTISAAIALYWATSNIFAIVQELLIRKHARKLEEQNGN